MNRRSDSEFAARIVSKTHAIAALLWLCTLCSVLLAQDGQVPSSRIKYTSAASILALPYGVAAQGGLARVVGTVTLSSSLGLVVRDHTAGLWVDPDGTSRRYEPGDRIEVVGLVGPGQYSPRITAPHIRFLGHGPLPTPTEVSFRQLSSGQQDVQYVSIEGTIRAVNSRTKIAGLEGIAFSIMMPEGRVDAILTSSLKLPLSAFFDARVRVTATAMDRKNDNMQSTGVVLAIPDPNNIEILQPKPPDPFETPMLQIGNLMRYGSGTDYFHPVRVRGVLTFYAPGNSLVLQDGTQAIEIFSADAPTLQVGDLVEAVGYPSPDATGPILRDAVLRKLGHGTPLTPAHLDLQSTSSSKYRFCLISIEMRLLRVIDEPARTLLLLEKDDQVITAELEAHSTGSSKALVPGSAVRVSGINVLTGETGLTYGNAIRSELLLRSLADVSVVRAAPWWTTARLVNLSIALGAVAAVILVLLFYVQLKRWKMETVLHERERLARDIHDTLAQSFTGIGFQLQVIRRSVANKEDSALHHVDVARRLVQFSHREARKSLTPISKKSFSSTDLLSSLRECAQGLTGSGDIAIETSSSGISRALPSAITEQMFHIGQEAIANSVRHASPTKVAIAIDYQPEHVQLKVTDNGRGFTMSGDLLGFGIRGMRRRASEIAGELDISCMLGTGTCVSVTVPVLGINRLTSYVRAGIRFLENTIHAKNKRLLDPHSDR
ncbi:two-component system sensor kinase [Acidisarcina polymorpha]|uniref:Two-component system sensor kinase n=1 Tax=Acidisarcina polymorpha TaxID=2211140 RepID=A0A2Z5G3P3_9BACT|nr:sensor histidine kinase [Acidisarcina polymorpha]AXC13640.1 two-component system sensor kinase [Acidisarcina polymorpha]